jgi:multicomponent Na+:H+ antiporter subunit A
LVNWGELRHNTALQVRFGQTPAKVNNYMLVAVLSGFVLAGLAPLVTMIGRKATGWILALLPLGLFIYFGSFIGPVSAGAVIAEARPWVPTLGISLSFYLDGLSLIFALIITGIGSLVIIYGGGYLAGDRQISRFYVYILMFMASMLGIVLADNVITLFVFWELTSVSSFLLIGYYHEQADSRAAALQALLVTGAGGLALLAGLTIMALVGGSWEISELLNRGEILANSALYPAILGLVLAGAFTKSAQFPFHFWLPNAMAAPAPVSTYLHSATMVKAGIYLLARLSPALGNTGAWLYLVTGFGVVTMLLGAYIAWQQTDLKRILAYSTVSALGLLVVHSLYKGSLFMVAGTVDHETGMRFIDRLGGLRRLMPITATAAVLAALSMSGVPLFLGFIGKELIYEATMEGEVAWQVLTASAVLANILTIVAAGLVTVRPFFGKLALTPKRPHEAPVSMWLGPIILAGLGLLLGLISIEAIALNIDKALVSPAVSAVLAEPTVVSLHLFPDELSLVLLLSAITIAGGIGVYLVRDRLYRAVQPLSMVTRWGPERWYAWTLDGMMILARYQTRLLQSGYLRYYLMTVILTTVIMAGYTLVTQTTLDVNAFWRQTDFTLYEFLIYVTILAATVMIVRSRSRLAAVAALGVVGYGIALLFILFSAPDLAMTQFSIETLSVILLVLVLYRLPRFAVFSSANQKLRDTVVALVSGGLMTALVLIVTALPSLSRVTPYYAEMSLTEAKGHNVVNVILVDFRGIDTMGEITVLAVAAIGVYGLMKLRMEKSKLTDFQKRTRQSTDVFPTVAGTEKQWELTKDE